jgi:hypothetical protein
LGKTRFTATAVLRPTDPSQSGNRRYHAIGRTLAYRVITVISYIKIARFVDGDTLWPKEAARRSVDISSAAQHSRKQTQPRHRFTRR